MRIWKRGIIGVASAAVIATGAIAAFASNETQPSPQRTTSVDVKGPCDEAEHANDLRCAGTQAPEDRPGAGADAANDDGPNHDANDDGPNHDANDDHGGENSGPSNSSGSGSHGEDHLGSDDNSGPGSSSSGRGSSGEDD